MIISRSATHSAVASIVRNSSHRSLSYWNSIHAQYLAKSKENTGESTKLENQWTGYSPRDLEHAIFEVRSNDPAAYLPGILLDNRMSLAYFVVRSFWVETGLSFGSTALVAPNSTPLQHLDWWQQSLDFVFGDRKEGDFNRHPTIRLLSQIQATRSCWTRDHFDEILKGRRNDLDIKQYRTLDELKNHAEQSCGSLIEIVLQSGGIDSETNCDAHRAARLVGICHGLTNALRKSIGIVSLTGRLVIPLELTQKHGVDRPRYLLSALSIGDEAAVGLRKAVADIVHEARDHLSSARELRSSIIDSPDGHRATRALLVGLASETFLDRLERADFDLTNRNLRFVGGLENILCSTRIVSSFLGTSY